jgi:zinc protease
MEMQMFTDRVSKNRQVYGFVATYKNGNGLDALEELYGFVSSFEKYGFSITDFELAKRLILSNLEKTHARYMDIQSKDIAKILVETIENNSTYIDHNYDYNTTKKLISSMTLEEINQTFKDILNIQNRAIIFKDTMGHKFAENRVYEVLKNASKNAGDLSKVEKVASHIIDTNLTKGKIVSKKFDSQLGIYSYKLENNITVEFRPDSQNKNLLTLEAFSAGGYSILKGEELLISKNATNIVMQSAPANWTNIELAKILTGKEIEVVPSIERFGEKIVATCNTKDIDMMFELLYARVTKAKVDTRVLENMKVMLSDNIIQAKRNPQYLLLMDVLKEYYNDNPEIKPISKEQISRLKASSILALYRDRFADMNNFHFVISGDTTTETIERLIGKYLANLPTQNRVEEYNTKRYSHPSGKVQITKYYNTENRANITMQYSSKVDFNTKNNLRTMIASNILSIRLRTLIREEKSGVYNIGVKTELTHELKDEAITNITFACDPIRKDELIDAIYPAIDELNRNGVTTQELAELKKMIHLEYEKQIGQNSFWADNIMSSHRFHTPKDDIINLPKILDSITKEDIQETAQALFGDDILIAILMPKKYHAIDKQGEKK